MNMKMTIRRTKKPSIKGIGNDIVEIRRIEDSIQKYGERFLKRIFTDKEILYCKRHHQGPTHFAGRFAAKEAIAKALGCGIGKHLSWQDLEIVNDAQGKPVVALSQKAQEKFSSPRILISISHCRAYATAMAVWQ